MEMSEGGRPSRQRGSGGALGAVLAGLVAAVLVALALDALGGSELVLVPLMLLPGLVTGLLRRRDGCAGGLLAGLLALLLVLLGLLLLRDAEEPRSWLEFFAAWVYPGVGIVLGNTLGGVLGVVVREEQDA